MAWRDNADGTSELDFKQGKDSEYSGVKLVLAKTLTGGRDDIRLLGPNGVYLGAGAESANRNLTKSFAMDKVLSFARTRNITGKLLSNINAWVPMNGYEAFFAGPMVVKVATLTWSLGVHWGSGITFLCEHDIKTGMSVQQAKVAALAGARELLGAGLPSMQAMEEAMRRDMVVPRAVAVAIDPERMIQCVKSPANHPAHRAGERCSYC